MTTRLDLFDDFHLHGASAPEWNQRYQQISPGTMRSTLAEATSDGLHVFRKWMSERVVQQGCLPRGQICFAVPLGAAEGTPRMQGREMDAHSLFVLRSGEEFTLQRPRGFELLAVTFDGALFERLLDERPWASKARSLLGRSVLQAPPAALERVRRELLGLFYVPAPEASVADSTLAASSLAVFDALFDLFHHAADGWQAAGSASASYIVAECHRLVAHNDGAPFSVEALCERLRVSRRTLQNSFQQVADATPVHYLRSVRLNAVRQQLMNTPASQVSVAQAAADQGFEHLSHFSERYKALFGELPSKTMRAR